MQNYLETSIELFEFDQSDQCRLNKLCIWIVVGICIGLQMRATWEIWMFY